MDLGIVAALLVLVGWAIVTFLFDAPGWVHLFLTLGVFALIWRIVVLGTRGSKQHTGPGGRRSGASGDPTDRP